METTLTHESLPQSVPARDVYPSRDQTLELLNRKLDDGSFTIRYMGQNESGIDVGGYNKSSEFDGIDFSNVPYEEYGAYSPQDIVNLLPQEQRSLFMAEVDHKVKEKSMPRFAKNSFWWVQRGDEDNNAWLDNSLLFGVGLAEIGGKQIVINDFSGKINREKFHIELEELLNSYTQKGLNPAEFFSVINILGADQPIFAVPEHIKAKNPKAFKAAQATESGVLIFNEEMLNANFDDAEDNGFTVGRTWQATFNHELAHRLDLGLAGCDTTSELTVGLGWRKKVDVNVDDYGNLFETGVEDGRYYGIRIVDNYGNLLTVPNANLPDILLNDGKKDFDGGEIKPPSVYAHENSAEDIAESFAAYMSVGSMKKQLDSRRKSAMDKLLKDNSHLDGKNRAVRVKGIDVQDFKPLDLIAPTIKVRLSIGHKLE